jgi:hypothetical protein
VNSEKLDALSEEALWELAEKIGINLPAESARALLIEELLEALKEDSEDRQADKEAAVHIDEKKFSGSELDAYDASLDAAPFIEHRYNETMIRLLVRDPAWAFAYWDINDFDAAALVSEGCDRKFFLRLEEEKGKSGRDSNYFDIPIGDGDLQWYINLPREETAYRVELCTRCNGRIRNIARSNRVYTPRSKPVSDFDNNSDAMALFMLSGAEEFDIGLRENRHPSRILSSEGNGD